MKTPSSAAFVNSLLACSLVAIGCTGTVGLGMVWARRQISVLAADNKALATRIAEIDRRCQEIGADIAEEQDPAALLQRNTQWSLGLVPPAPEQERRLPGDPAAHLAAKGNRGLFADRAVPVTFSVAAQP